MEKGVLTLGFLNLSPLSVSANFPVSEPKGQFYRIPQNIPYIYAQATNFVFLGESPIASD